jgi:uncharacterized cupredoxin-like copper-binding protein
MHLHLPPILGIAAALAISPAQAYSDSHTKKSAVLAAHAIAEKSFGKAGDAKKVTRTIGVDMSDRMRFTPDALTVKQDETIKFVVKNSGKTVHEFVLGTMAELQTHADMMKKHPGMEHEAPHMAHVAPGKTATMVWQFTKAGEFHFGCLLPGHLEAGMVGNIGVAAK